MPETNEDNKQEKNVLSEEEKTQRTVQLRKLLKDERLLEGLRTDDQYLIRFLYGTDFNSEKAFDKMKMYYNLLLEYPDWYRKSAPVERKSLIEKDIRVVIPQVDREGRPIYIAKLGNLDVSKMELLDVVSVDDIWLESVILGNPEYAEKGLCVIIDIYNFSLKMIKWMTPDIVKKSVKKLQTFPFKEYRFHVVNNSYLIHAGIKLIMPFLPQYIKDMIKFHFDDWESLYQYVDKDVLPPEYGGNTEVDYRDIYEKLYERNNEILESFTLYRTLDRH